MDEWPAPLYRAEDCGLRIVPPDTLISFGVDVEPDAFPDLDSCMFQRQQPQEFDHLHDLNVYRSEMEALMIDSVVQSLKNRPFSNSPIEFSAIISNNEFSNPANLLRNRFGPLDTNTLEYEIMLEGFIEELNLELQDFISKVNGFLTRKTCSYGSSEEQINAIYEKFQPANLGFIPENDPVKVQSPHLLKSKIEVYDVPRFCPNNISPYLNCEISANENLEIRELKKNSTVRQAMKILLENPLGITPESLDTQLKIENSIDHHKKIIQSMGPKYEIPNSAGNETVHVQDVENLRKNQEGEELWDSQENIDKLEKIQVKINDFNSNFEDFQVEVDALRKNQLENQMTIQLPNPKEDPSNYQSQNLSENPMQIAEKNETEIQEDDLITQNLSKNFNKIESNHQNDSRIGSLSIDLQIEDSLLTQLKLLEEFSLRIRIKLKNLLKEPENVVQKPENSVFSSKIPFSVENPKENHCQKIFVENLTENVPKTLNCRSHQVENREKSENLVENLTENVPKTLNCRSHQVENEEKTENFVPNERMKKTLFLENGFLKKPINGLLKKPINGLLKKPINGFYQKLINGFSKKPVNGILKKPLNGISLNASLNIRAQRKNLPEKLIEFQYENIEDFLDNFPNIFQLRRSSSQTLIFPANIPDITNISIIRRNLFHHILILLLLAEGKFKIGLDEIPDKLKQVFGIKFYPKAWSSGSEVEFYTELLEDFDEEHKIGLEGFSLELLAPPKPSKMEILRENLGIEEEPTFDKYSIQFFQIHRDKDCKENWDIVMEFAFPSSVADQISAGETYYVQAEYVLDPFEFHVCLVQNFVLRDEFVASMTQRYKQIIDNPELNAKTSILRDSLEPHFHVAVRYEDDWLRGKIVEDYRDGYCCVYQIDYGDYFDVKITDMKYLLQDYLNFPAQSFVCSLRRRPFRLSLEGNGNIEFAFRTRSQLRRVFGYNQFVIKPLNRVQQTGCWIVNVWMIEEFRGKRTVILSDLVMPLLDVEEDEDSIENPAPSNFRRPQYTVGADAKNRNRRYHPNNPSTRGVIDRGPKNY